MVLPLTKKQNDSQTISQLYQHFKSPRRSSRDSFQKMLYQLSSNPFDIALALASIRDKNILNLENFSLILIHPSPFEISMALIQLHDVKLLNTQNKKALERHNCPTGIALVLRLLHSVKLLTPANRSAIQEKNDPHSVANVLFKLFYADLFTQKNFEQVLAHPHLLSINNLVRAYDRQHILTQTIFEKLMGSPQEKNFLCRGENKLKKFAILPKQISNALIYHCGTHTGFFLTHKHQSDPASPTKTELRQVCKN